MMFDFIFYRMIIKTAREPETPRRIGFFIYPLPGAAILISVSYTQKKITQQVIPTSIAYNIHIYIYTYIPISTLINIYKHL